jgi:enediyne biosynthesis protein E4
MYVKLGTLAVSLAAILASTAAVTIVALQGAAQRGVSPAAAPTTVRYPTTDIGVSSLGARAKAQRDTASQFKVFYQFQFRDTVTESGITFFNYVVDDAARFHKPVHYDHGTGIAVADVDGDGREDVYFVNQLTGSQLWKNMGGGRFRNLNSVAGVALADRVGVTASFADTDNDGDQDLFVTTVRGGNVLLENDGRGRFSDISKAAGVDYVGHSSGAVFFDYDNDGLLDLYVCNVGRYTTDSKGRGGAYEGLQDAFLGHLHRDRSESAILYKNIGGNRFRDVTKEVGLGDAGWSGDASVADLNGDGYSDLYALNMQGAGHFFESVGGKKFVDSTAKYFPKTPWGSMGIKFFDYDNDRRPDLLITDMHSDMSENSPIEREKLKARELMEESMLGAKQNRFIFGNAFYANRGNGKFEEVSDRVGAENYWPWGPSVGDLNADGWQDVFIASSMNFPYRYGINSLLLNNRGERFLDSEFLLGIEPRKGGRTHTFWFNLDCSTDDAELLRRWPNAAQDMCKGQYGKFTIMAPLGTRSSVIFDLNQDGALDIVTNEFNSVPQILVSDLPQRRPINWLKVALAGTISNRNGLGATVRVVAGGRVFTQWNDGKSGYLSQSVLPLYFGLGEVTKIDRVEVDWPSGRKQVVAAGLSANSTLRVTEVR